MSAPFTPSPLDSIERNQLEIRDAYPGSASESYTDGRYLERRALQLLSFLVSSRALSLRHLRRRVQRNSNDPAGEYPCRSGETSRGAGRKLRSEFPLERRSQHGNLYFR